MKDKIDKERLRQRIFAFGTGVAWGIRLIKSRQISPLSTLVPILALVIAIPLSGCTPTTVSVKPDLPKKQAWCDRRIYSEDVFEQCLELAKSGDPNAALNVAEVYGQPFPTWGFNIKRDKSTAFYWYKVAADLGQKDALLALFDSYYWGRLGPDLEGGVKV